MKQIKKQVQKKPVNAQKMARAQEEHEVKQNNDSAGLFRIKDIITDAMNAFLKNFTILLLGFILITGTILRVLNADILMAFIGDQGWYYLSARDMILTGQIPLVGIPSSHPWLSQGAYWTYLLGPFLLLFDFDPVSGVYLSALVDAGAVIAIYFLGREIVSVRAGLIAAVLYAFSPYLVKLSHFPYHTGPIPLFTILAIFCFYKTIKGNVKYFPAVIFFLGVLYNFEVATFVLGIAFAIIFLFYLWKKEKWATGIINKKIILVSILAFIIPMLPMIIHDFGHQFPQTLKFAAWVGYRVLIAIHILPSNQLGVVSYSELFRFLYEHNGLVIFGFNYVIALLITMSGLVYLVRARIKRELLILFVINFILILGFIIVKTPSQAYLPVIIPAVLVSSAVLFDGLIADKRFRVLAIPFIMLIILFNIFYSVWKVYLMPSADLPNRIRAAHEIIKLSGGENYNLKGEGPGSIYDSFTMNYEYLTWYLGHGPSKKETDLIIVVRETNNEISVFKELKSGL